MLNKKVKLSLISEYRSQIMGFAAICIVIFHLWLSLFTRVPVVSTIERVIKNICYCGVDIFFLVSAIGLYYSLSKDNNLKSFYKKRYLKLIFPWLLCGILTAISQKWSLSQFVANISGYSFFSKSIYTFKWYVIAICIIYLLFPIYYSVFNKVNKKGLFTTIVISIWVLIFSLFTARVDLYGIIWRIPIFLVGVYFGYLMKNKDVEIPMWFIILLLVAGCLIFYLNFTKMIKLPIVEPNSLIANSLLAVSLSFVVALVSGKCKVVKEVLKKLGSCSLQMYLFQELIGYVVIDIVVKPCGKLITNILVCVIVSLLCYYLEKFFNKINKLVFKV